MMNMQFWTPPFVFPLLHLLSGHSENDESSELWEMSPAQLISGDFLERSDTCVKARCAGVMTEAAFSACASL